MNAFQLQLHSHNWLGAGVDPRELTLPQLVVLRAIIVFAIDRLIITRHVSIVKPREFAPGRTEYAPCDGPTTLAAPPIFSANEITAGQ